MQGFIYLWRDSLRNMYYIGSHEGVPTDSYTSSSRWFNGEYHYRPQDFKRRILKISDIEEIRKLEWDLLARIKDCEYNTKYYNQKVGRKKGQLPWNAGKTMSEDYCKAISEGRKGKGTGKPAWNKGVKNPNAAENGRKSAEKLSKTITGRKIAVVDGKRTWVYPEGV